MSQFSTPYPALRVFTDAPGAVVEVIELADGVRVELNGAGSVAALLYPTGLDGECGCELDDWESPKDRVKRLAAELKEARKSLADKAETS